MRQFKWLLESNDGANWLTHEGTLTNDANVALHFDSPALAYYHVVVNMKIDIIKSRLRVTEHEFVD